MFNLFKRDKKKGKCFILNDKIFVTEKERKKKGIKTILLYGDEDLDLRNVFAQNIKDFGLYESVICFSKDRQICDGVYSDKPYRYNIDFRDDVIRFSPFERVYYTYPGKEELSFKIIVGGFRNYLETKPDVYSSGDVDVISKVMDDTLRYMRKTYLYSRKFTYITFVDFFKENVEKNKSSELYKNHLDIINFFEMDVLENLVKKSNYEACMYNEVGMTNCFLSDGFKNGPLFIEPPQFGNFFDEDSKNLVILAYSMFMKFFLSYAIVSAFFGDDYIIYLDDFQDYAFDLSDLTVGFRTKLIVVAIKLKNGENIEDYKEKYSIKPDLEYKLWTNINPTHQE